MQNATMEPLTDEQKAMVSQYYPKARIAARAEAKRGGFKFIPDRQRLVNELESIISMAMIRAAQDYDPNHSSGAAFWTLAYTYIQMDLRREWVRQERWFRTPGAEKPKSINDTGRDGESGIAKNLAAPSVRLSKFEANEEISKALSCLGKLERLIIVLREAYVVPLYIIGNFLGVSRQRVQQIHKIACRKLVRNFPQSNIKPNGAGRGKGEDRYYQPILEVKALLLEVKKYRTSKIVRTKCGRKRIVNVI